ncbi:CAP domain-containing protein [Paenibacillus sp. PL2-23]|uniref:CAP domain-containing protein n=1 Tax=Paenibacillus sp. PL2-23 TaxID=2100729 RepID=UPI0030F7161E
MKGHWSSSYITWAMEEGLTNGYEDGTFQPDKPITEAEFLALLLRAYGLISVADVAAGSQWHAPYYEYANSLGWPMNHANTRGSFLRGQAALLMATAARGVVLTEREAIKWLLDEGISNGRTAATIEGFASTGSITRAEALTFLYKLKLHTKLLSSTKLPTVQSGLYGIELGDHVDKLIALHGKPDGIVLSEYAFSWHVYTGGGQYEPFAMYGLASDRIVAAFSPSKGGWQLPGGLTNGLPLASAKPLLAGVTGVRQEDDYYAYSAGGVRTTLFLDALDGDGIVGILKQQEGLKASTARDDKLRDALEQTLFDLVNAERVTRGISALSWDRLAAQAARLHSEDMRDHNYFSHTNKGNASAFDRMESQGIRFRYAAENIAAGQPNSFFAHYAFLNSASHRKAMLDAKLTKLGVGVALGGSYKQYFTQNYYSPL